MRRSGGAEHGEACGIACIRGVDAGAANQLQHQLSLILVQQELDLEDDNGADKTRLMSALDTINQRYGKGTMKIASAGLAGSRRVWSMKQERRTPGYTTCVDDIPVARA